MFGDEGTAEAWAKLEPKILTVTQGWSEAYGMFTDGGEVDMVLSFTTSPAYHIGAENDTTKKHAAIFEEGHYLLAELAAQLKGTDQPELAQQFMDYILSPDFQGMIAEANWSLILRNCLPTNCLISFKAPPRPATTLLAARGCRRCASPRWKNGCASSRAEPPAPSAATLRGCWFC